MPSARKASGYLFAGLCLISGACGSVFAQAQDIGLAAKPPVKLYDPAAYGGHRQTWSIAQATDRTMGFANSEGLLLFDGSRWQQLPSPQGNELRSLVFRPQDQRWIAGSYAAWYSWPLEKLTQTSPEVSEIWPTTKPKEEWWQAVEVPEEPGSYLWQTFSKMIMLSPDNSISEVELPGNIVFSQRVGDKLFLPVLGEGLYVWQNNTWTLFSNHPDLLDVELVGMVSLEGEDVLAATNTGRLLRINERQVSDWPNKSNRVWSQYRLNRLLKLEGVGYAIGTVGKGILMLDERGALRYHLTDKDLGDGTVLSMFQDAAGDLWAGLDNGIAHIRISSPVHFFGKEQGAVYDIALNENGLYLATNQGLYNYPVSNTGVLSTIPKTVLSEQIWYLTDSPHGLLVGSNSATNVLEGTNLRKISTLPGGWCWLQVDSFTAFSGTYNGIERYILRGRNWESQGQIRNYAEPVKQLACSPHEGLMAMHPREGLFQLRLSDDHSEVTRVHLIDSFAKRIEHKLIIQSSIRTSNWAKQASHTCDSKNEVVFFSNVKGDKKGISTEDVFFTNQEETISIVQGDSIFHVNFRQNGLLLSWKSDTSFFEAQPNMEYPSAIRIGADQLAVGLTKGIAIIDLSKSVNPVLTPQPWVQVIHAARGVRVEFGQPIFGKAPQWRVKLEGIDAAFTDWTVRPFYDFPLLPAGDYTLHWESREGGEGTVSWSIPARWFETTWAFGSYLGIGFFALWGLRIYYRRKLKREAQAAELERERQLTAERLRTRTAALEAEVEVSKRAIALQQAEVLHRNRELARSTMTLARQNDTLLQLRQALDPLPKSGEVGKARRHIAHLIDGHLQSEEDWAFFDEHFNLVHAGFLKRLNDEFPSLSPGDLRLAALLRMNMASKEIAPLLHISLRGIENKRYRLRKKLGLDAETNLTQWILDY